MLLQRNKRPSKINETPLSFAYLSVADLRRWLVVCSPSIDSISRNWAHMTPDLIFGVAKIWKFRSRFVFVYLAELFTLTRKEQMRRGARDWDILQLLAKSTACYSIFEPSLVPVANVMGRKKFT